jgi:predicted PurR-regulated permease PerM
MYQFLDLGSTGIESSHGSTPMGQFMSWVEQFSQWGIQIFSIGLFTVLFYLSGRQLHKHLIRYETCVKRLARDFTEDRAD